MGTFIYIFLISLFFGVPAGLLGLALEVVHFRRNNNKLVASGEPPVIRPLITRLEVVCELFVSFCAALTVLAIATIFDTLTGKALLASMSGVTGLILFRSLGVRGILDFIVDRIGVNH